MDSIYDRSINTTGGKCVACDDDKVARWVAPLVDGVGDDHIEPSRVGRRMIGILPVVRRPEPTQASTITGYVEITRENGKTVMNTKKKTWNIVDKPTSILLPPAAKEVKTRTKNKPLNKKLFRKVQLNLHTKRSENERRYDGISHAKYQVLLYMRVAYKYVYSIDTLDKTPCLITALIASFLTDDTAEGSANNELTKEEQLVKKQMQREYNAYLRVINKETENEIQAIDDYFGTDINIGFDNKENALATVEHRRQQLIKRLNDKPEITYEEHNFVEERPEVKQAMKRFHYNMDDIGYYK